jgi:glutamate-1-semialdehyde 2,1-aminomutase/spore coat polysaccharide biosynthesis protein SpsF
MGSASDVQPDIACFGKAIGNGFPVSCLVGKRDIMRHMEPGGVFFSGTAFGETVSLAACEATLEVMERDNVPAKIGQMGRELRDGFNLLADAAGLADVRCVGDGARTTVAGLSHELRDLLQQECAKRGMLFIGSHIMSIAHVGMIDEALSVYGQAFDAIANGATLEGESTVIPFRLQ